MRLRSILMAATLCSIGAVAQTKVQIAPQLTDPAIDTFRTPHSAFLDTTVAQDNLLFVFFSGSNGAPGGYDEITGLAAKMGYHSIGLMYSNSPAVGLLCAASADSSCYEDVRLEIIDGTDRTSLVTVNRTNSIENRLVKLLRYLDQHDTRHGWSQFLTSADVILWDKIVVAGHSQGGGHAALIGKYHAVNRVVQFSSVADFSGRYNAPAPWITTTHVTPTDRYYGFGHTGDNTVPWDELQRNWTALGMDAYGRASVDSVAPPYNQARELRSSASPANPSSNASYHNCTVVDNASARDGQGNSIYVPVWRYLLDQGVTATRRTSLPQAATGDARTISGAGGDVCRTYDVRGRLLAPRSSRSGVVILVLSRTQVLSSMVNKEE